MDNFHQEDSDICLHSNENLNEYWGSIAPPIVQTSLFAFENWDSFLKGITSERTNYVYTRGVNPTTEILEKKLAELEKGEKCKCFTSGMAAISSTIFSLVEANEHILFVNNVYGPTVSYVKTLGKFNVDYTQIFINDESEIEEYITDKTKMIYIESPSTMNFDVLDFSKISKIAKERNIITVIDNTWATPLVQKPIEHGIDLVVHSLTKYIAGHSDAVGGAVIGSYDMVDKIFEIGHQFGGGVISPFNSWLILRGLRTLPQRLYYQMNTVKMVIEYLKDNKKVLKINHPLAFEGKAKEIYEKQTNGYTSLFSVEVDFKNYEELTNFMNAFKVFKLGVSWGGYESLAISPNYNNEANHRGLEEARQSKNLVRIYLGLEDSTTLLDDLKRAFKVLEG